MALGVFVQLKKVEIFFGFYLTLSDDGVSGTTFDRDGFKAMIAELEAGYVTTIIVKDMSRFRRDYLKVGFYTDI